MHRIWRAQQRALPLNPSQTNLLLEVTVEPNQWLEQISVEYLGGYDSQRLHQIQALNPDLTDPNHIEVGQKIRLPKPPPVTVASNPPTPVQCEDRSMSRNFELMTQLERESGIPIENNQPQPPAPLQWRLFPLPASLAGDPGGEEMLRLIQRIFLSANGSAPRQVVLCGVDDENGSSSVCAKAGRTLAANSSRPVCIVDANVRSSRLLRTFGLDRAALPSGSSAPLREQCVKIGSNLWLAGSHILADNSRVLLPPDQLKERLAQLREEFEYMLIDAPAVSVCGDAQLLGLVADAAILVIEANNTRRLTARKAKEPLEAAGVRLLGTVLHNRSFPIPEGLYSRL